eukprot:CAMPEP_0194196706 /NCGR_PEP_ID=MMETSP0154-20130528/76810_1 /TAXON_ID=1049557 /ORGANISM="Thalassiothrix antarctica, Strain L6-D1" /LENGTH=61 /DNA_ID=CAMNT_0038921321 /DNA_START=783 /DNA_END=964 /DNA_ORIENTATION=+
MVDYLKSRRGTGRLSITSREMIKIPLPNNDFHDEETNTIGKKTYQQQQQHEIIAITNEDTR